MTLNELYSDGTIKLLHKKGLISGNIVLYFQYVETFNEFRKKYSYRVAVLETSIIYNVSDKTIERAVRTLKDQ